MRRMMPMDDGAAFVELSHNRTGIATARELAERMLEGAREFLPSRGGDGREILEVRANYAKGSEPLGSIPEPTSRRASFRPASQSFRSVRPSLFIDKLGERLAFERSTGRLYQAAISKLDAFGGFNGGPCRDELEDMMRKEYEHFRLLSEVIENVGSDPTVLTPSADLYATMSRGVVDVMVDARTSFVQCLEGLLLLELVDNDGWAMLSDVAQQNGEATLARLFEAVQNKETEHLDSVRTWLAAAHNRSA